MQISSVSRRNLLRSGGFALLSGPAAILSYPQTTAGSQVSSQTSNPTTLSPNHALLRHATSYMEALAQGLSNRTATSQTFADAGATLHMAARHFESLDVDTAYSRQVSSLTYEDYTSKEVNLPGNEVRPVSEDQFNDLMPRLAGMGFSGVLHSHARLFSALGGVVSESSSMPAAWHSPTGAHPGSSRVGVAHFQRVCSIAATSLTPTQKQALCNALTAANFFLTINSFELAVFCWAATFIAAQPELGVLCSAGTAVLVGAVTTAISTAQIAMGC